MCELPRAQQKAFGLPAGSRVSGVLGGAREKNPQRVVWVFDYRGVARAVRMPSSQAEVDYTLKGVAQDLREDGRQRLDFRHLELEVGPLPHANGSARLRAGGADALIGVNCLLSEPAEETPELGRIVVTVGCGPGDAAAAGLPEYASGALNLDEKRLWLESAMALAYSASSIPDALRTLCIAPGRHCWELRVHVQLIRTDGCPLDAISLGVRAALHNTLVPSVTVVDGSSSEGAVGGGSELQAASGTKTPLDLDLDESIEESTPFAAETLPLFITLATLDSQLVADCTSKERDACSSASSLAFDAQGRVCATCAGGGEGLHLASLASAMQTAQQLSRELHQAASSAIEHAVQRCKKEQEGGADEGFVGML
jgi:exosome complex component RRP42